MLAFFFQPVCAISNIDCDIFKWKKAFDVKHFSNEKAHKFPRAFFIALACGLPACCPMTI